MKMIEFVKGVGGGNDFVLVYHNESYDYSNIALRILRRRFSVGGDGLIVMDGKRMRFFNPDGIEVPFCGNGVRVFFYLLYIEGRVEGEDTIMTGAGDITLKYEDYGKVSALMPKVEIGEKSEDGVMVYCGVPHLVINVEDVNNVDAESEGLRLSSLVPGGNNVDWVSREEDTLAVRTYERGVLGETLSCASGIAAASYFLMEDTGKEQFRIKTKGGDFEVIRRKDSQGRLLLTGDVKITFKGSIPEKEDYWQRKESFLKD